MSDKLTVAQALRRIKKLKGLLAESQRRAVAGVSYDVTKVPAFGYKDSVDAMFATQDEVVALEARVAVANATAVVKDGTEDILMARAVRTLQELKGRIAFLKGLSLRNETVKDRTKKKGDVLQCKYGNSPVRFLNATYHNMNGSLTVQYSGYVSPSPSPSSYSEINYEKISA